MKFGLHGIRTLLTSLDHPEKQFSSIHVAGTNGKGSTASMIASIFTAAGYKTGLYTSPHIVRFNERIRVNGKAISSRAAARLATAIRSQVEKKHYTFFEAVTAMAFKYFAESHVDIAVVETGLGGRLDATNTLLPLVSVITTIGLEHTQILGTSLEKIAFEKGGIVKKGVPCITGVKSQKAVQVLSDICIKKKSQFIRVRPNRVLIHQSSLDGLLVDCDVAGKNFKNVRISLAGMHQAMNALLALHAVTVAVQRSNFTVDEKAIREGLADIKRFSGIQARLSVVQRNPLVLADVAHNPEAVRVLCASLKRLHLGKIHIVFGLMQDKNYLTIISELRQIAKSVFIVEAQTERSRSTAEIAREIRRVGLSVKEFHTVADGVASALSQRDGAPILITGSHFVIGEAVAFLNKEKYLTINQ
ncbi:MAG: bifunctional folylpolyglutamate synthase/dihydrofolate synthase [Ignavibacteriales bacterium]|nr:bifunctional folylpolyglutamate synthase/dihydrofolate synthase [Ignavibacteriales bacterium]